MTNSGFQSSRHILANTCGNAHLVQASPDSFTRKLQSRSAAFPDISGKRELGRSREGGKPGQGQERDPSPRSLGV